MKYLAILKDSIREARDSKVLYVLLGLSAVVILFVATFSFKPLSAEKTFKQFFLTVDDFPIMILVFNDHKPTKLIQAMLDKSTIAPASYRLDKVVQLSGETDSPRGDYQLTMSSVFGRQAKDHADMEKAKEQILSIFADAAKLNLLELGPIEVVTDDKEGSPSYQLTIQGNSQTVRIWATEPAIFFGAVPLNGVAFPLGYLIYFPIKQLIGFGSWIALLAAVIITSFFIPNMLRKGTIDMLLVKPIHRWALLLYKYVGGLCFMLFSSSFAVAGIWLALGLRSGLWANNIFLLIPTLTFFFAILYAISTFVGVVTRGTIPAIILTIAAWFVFFLVGVAEARVQARHLQEEAFAKTPRAIPEDQKWGDGRIAQIIHAIYRVTPRTADLDNLNDLILYCSFVVGDLGHMDQFDTSKIVLGETVLVSAGWIAFFLVLSCLWFTYKDY